MSSQADIDFFGTHSVISHVHVLSCVVPWKILNTLICQYCHIIFLRPRFMLKGKSIKTRFKCLFEWKNNELFPPTIKKKRERYVVICGARVKRKKGEVISEITWHDMKIGYNVSLFEYFKEYTFDFYPK